MPSSARFPAFVEPPARHRHVHHVRRGQLQRRVVRPVRPPMVRLARLPVVELARPQVVELAWPQVVPREPPRVVPLEEPRHPCRRRFVPRLLPPAPGSRR